MSKLSLAKLSLRNRINEERIKFLETELYTCLLMLDTRAVPPPGQKLLYMADVATALQQVLEAMPKDQPKIQLEYRAIKRTVPGTEAQSMYRAPG